MKKVLLSSIFLLLSIISLLAQGGTLTATLVSGETSSVFYGQPSFQNAYNAAQTGDVIYLSAGNFPDITIEKAITVIGAGADKTIMNIMTVRTPLTQAKIEGMGFWTRVHIDRGVDNGNIIISKCDGHHCWIGNYNTQPNMSNTIEINGCSFEQIGRQSGNGLQSIRPTKLFTNNTITNLLHGMEGGGESVVQNSIIFEMSYRLENTLLKNCILFTNDYITKTSLGVYNTVISSADRLNEVTLKSGNWENVDPSTIFVNQSGTVYDPTHDYHLKNPETYIGTDDTQIGIYGGAYPWNPTPSNPKITAKKVAEKTTNDGKLQVEITVEAQP